MTGTVISGLIRTVTDERIGPDIRRTTCRYDPESFPPRKVETLVEWFRYGG